MVELIHPRSCSAMGSSAAAFARRLSRTRGCTASGGMILRALGRDLERPLHLVHAPRARVGGEHGAGREAFLVDHAAATESSDHDPGCDEVIVADEDREAGLHESVAARDELGVPLLGRELGGAGVGASSASSVPRSPTLVGFAVVGSRALLRAVVAAARP